MRDPALDGSSALIICRSCRPVMERDTSGQGRHHGGMSSKWLGPKIGYNYLQMAVLMVKMMINNWYTVKIEGKKKGLFSSKRTSWNPWSFVSWASPSQKYSAKNSTLPKSRFYSSTSSFSTGWNNSCIRMLLLHWEKAQELERNTRSTRGSTTFRAEAYSIFAEVNHWLKLPTSPQCRKKALNYGDFKTTFYGLLLADSPFQSFLINFWTMLGLWYIPKYPALPFDDCLTSHLGVAWLVVHAPDSGSYPVWVNASISSQMSYQTEVLVGWLVF